MTRNTTTGRGGIDRRALLKTTAAGAAAAAGSLAGAAAGQTPEPDATPVGMPAGTPATASNLVLAEMVINGQRAAFDLDPRSSLLDLLRERQGLTGAKKGCDHGQCGACTVHLDGQRVVSCLTMAVQAAGREITTVEGLDRPPDGLHPMQQAFIDHDALQCGYCTPGQIMAAVAAVQEGSAGSDDAIREAMSGNLCRCGAYVGIVAAVRQAAPQMERR